MRSPDFEIEGVKMYMCDCRDVMRDIKGRFTVITDPPYGLNLKSKGSAFCKSMPFHGDDSAEAGQEIVDWAIASGIPIAAFCSPYRMWEGKIRNWLVWDKGGHVGVGGDRWTCWKRTFEMIAVANNGRLNGKRDESILCFNALSPPPSKHPCEKPVALIKYLIDKMTDFNDTVFDPFMGSGSTGEACVVSGRNFIGCETDENWFNYSTKRITDCFNRSKSSIFN